MNYFSKYVWQVLKDSLKVVPLIIVPPITRVLKKEIPSICGLATYVTIQYQYKYPCTSFPSHMERNATVSVPMHIGKGAWYICKAGVYNSNISFMQVYAGSLKGKHFCCYYIKDHY